MKLLSTKSVRENSKLATVPISNDISFYIDGTSLERLSIGRYYPLEDDMVSIDLDTGSTLCVSGNSIDIDTTCTNATITRIDSTAGEVTFTLGDGI
jgi:hypothetical protein